MAKGQKTVSSSSFAGGSMGLFADGTAAAPSISFANDTDLGFYRSASNKMHFVGGRLIFPSGTAALPSMATSWETTGIYGDGNAPLLVSVSGTLSFAIGISSTVRIYNNLGLNWNAATTITGATDGQLLLTNNAGTDFSRLQFGGTTSSFPALKRNAAQLDVKLADDSAYATIQAGGLLANWAQGGTWVLHNDAPIGLRLGSTAAIHFKDNASVSAGSVDTAIARSAAGIIDVTNGSTGTGTIVSNGAQIREGRLASATGIDLSSTSKQTLYTVPAGKTCYPTRFVVRDASAAITLATVTIGFNAGADDVVAATALTAIDNAAEYQILEPIAGAAEGAAAAVLGLDTTVQEGAADTVTVDVYGFLV